MFLIASYLHKHRNTHAHMHTRKPFIFYMIRTCVCVFVRVCGMTVTHLKKFGMHA